MKVVEALAWEVVQVEWVVVVVELEEVEWLVQVGLVQVGCLPRILAQLELLVREQLVDHLVLVQEWTVEWTVELEELMLVELKGQGHLEHLEHLGLELVVLVEKQIITPGWVEICCFLRFFFVCWKCFLKL
jgi:hypothetical protein